MNFKNIKINKDKNLGILKINRENFNNALDIETSKEILRGLKELESDKNINCIAIKGSSTFFSPGADIKELKDFNSKLAKKRKLFNNFDKISKIKIPIISLVEGHALGGGLELCLITDFIVASSEAKFGQPEINLGLIPGIGGTQRLQKYVGKFNASYICMSGDIITSMQAYEFGIVSKIVSQEKFEEESMEIAKKIAEKPKSSLIAIKKLMSLDKKIESNIKKERQIFYKLLDSKNKKIGIESFLKKNSPKWEN